MQAAIRAIIDGVILREGGYVDNPHDKGGPTKYGITEAVARDNGYMGKMVEMPRAIAFDIYTKRYVTEPGFDKVAALMPKVAAELIDTGVNMGPHWPAVFLQQALNVMNRSHRKQGPDWPELVEDGRLGNRTIAALSKLIEVRGDRAEPVLLKVLNVLQGYRYFEIARRNATQEEFFFGWVDHRIGELA
jgi:lysozyme family protein